MGTEGFAPYPFKTPFGIQYQEVEVKIDEKTLQDIATLTDGKYFRATNNNSLKEIYKDIDKLEKSKIEVTEFHKKIGGIFKICFYFINMPFNKLYFKNNLFKTNSLDATI